jgi:hypothetical protein
MNTHQSVPNRFEPIIESYPDEKSNETAEVIRRFNNVFLRRDPNELKELIAENCIIEKIAPAPDGDRCVGRDACIALWEGIATEPGAHFDLEEVFAAGERATIRWRYWRDDGQSIRGVNLMRIAGRRIVGAMGYVKGG